MSESLRCYCDSRSSPTENSDAVFVPPVNDGIFAHCVRNVLVDGIQVFIRAPEAHHIIDHDGDDKIGAADII